jgi:hypothetical protein
MNEIVDLWKSYNISSELLKEKLGRTSNLVGEYAEFLIKEYLGGELLTASAASADIKSPNGELHQVKSRKITNNLTTQLGIIRSWDFDFLTIVLFDRKGGIIKSLICQKSISEQYAIYNEHQNGWVISTTDKFLNDSNHIDITKQLRKINNDSELVFEKNIITKKRIETEYSKSDIKEIEIEKVKRKLPKWFSNPNYICSQILITFLELEDNTNFVEYEVLAHKCGSIKTFKSNFAQMMNFGEKNHGKVFEKNNSIVTIWNPIKAELMMEYKKYLK